MRTSSFTAFFLALLGLVPGEMRATCSASLSVSRTNETTVHIVATGGGTCDDASISVALDGNAIGGHWCGPFVNSCTFEFDYSTACMRTGTHTVTAWADCHKIDSNNNCVRDQDRTTASSTLTIDTKPQVSPGGFSPDHFGQGTFNIDYAFPNTGGLFDRLIEIFIDNQAIYGGFQSTSTGTVTFGYDVSCYRTGDHQVQVVGTACGHRGDPDYQAISSSSFHVNTHPTVGVSYTPDNLGQGTVTVPFDFPNTKSGGLSGQRFIELFFDGVAVGSTFPVNQTDTWSFPFSVACVREGSHELKVVATACGKRNDADYTDVKTQAVMVQSKPAISVNYAPDPTGHGVITVTYEFHNTTGVFDRLVEIAVNGTGIYGGFQSDQQGTVAMPYDLACRAQADIVANATACGHRGDADYTATDATTGYGPVQQCTGVDPNSCPLSAGQPGTGAGHPINVGSGDVTLTIPLFTIAQSPAPLSFSLSYHSSRPVHPGLAVDGLGPGWSHTFSERIRPVDKLRTRLYRRASTGREVFYDRVTAGQWMSFWPAETRETVVETNGEYRLTDLDGATIAFDVAGGRWKGTSDRWGNTISAAYDSSGNLTSITDTEGRQIVVSESGGALLQLTLSDGTAWRFAYGSGNLSAIYDPLHTGTTPWRTFEYQTNAVGERRLLTAMRDEAGVLLEGHAYDSRDRGLTSYVQDNRELVTVQYDTPASGQTRVLSTLDANTSAVTDYALSYQGGRFLPTLISGVCISCGATMDQQLFTYDSSNHVTQKVDGRGNVTVFHYNSDGNVLDKTEAAGTPIARTILYEYAMPAWPNFVTKLTEPSATGNGFKTTEQRWNSDETVLTVTTTGKLTAGGGSQVAYVTTSTFDGRHRLIEQDGPRNDVRDVTTRAYYDDFDPNAARRGRLRQITDALGLTTTFDDYHIYGTPRNTTDANGVVSRTETDSRGRTISTTSKAVAGDPAEATEYMEARAYDGRDRLTEMRRPRGNRTRFAYADGTNWRTDVVRMDNSGNEIEREHSTLNAIGNKTRDESQSCDIPAPTCSAWTTRRSQSFAYDNHDRLAGIEQPVPAGSKAVYTYDANGQLASVQDENHSSPNTIDSYDALNRLASVSQLLGGGQIVTRYAYDAQDNLTSVTDPNGNITTYSFDDFGRMQRQVSPVTGMTAYSYDPVGNLVSVTDANNATTTRTYDAGNRILTSGSTGSGSPENVTWTYDDTTAANYAAGRLATMADGAGSSAFTYDRRGLLRTERRTIQDVIYATAFGYDANGNRSSITSPSGRRTDYSFDYADRPLYASTGATTLVSNATYLPFGPLAQLQLGNGTTKVMQYDMRYRPLENKLTNGGGVIADSTYAEDAVGNITQIHDALNPAYNRDFGYDDLNRLTTANGGSSLWGAGTYQYDSMGNLIRLSLGAARNVIFQYSGTTSRLSAVVENGAARSVSYDASGNERAVGSDAFSYTAANHLESGSGQSFSYDGRGVRQITSTPMIITAVTVDTLSVTGGGFVTATVTLNTNAPVGGFLVAIASSSVSATVPAQVMIDSGSAVATFQISTTPVASQIAVQITVSLESSARSASFIIVPPAAGALAIDPTAVTGGAAATGFVTLSGPAPAGGVAVAITSNHAAVSVPSTLTVPAGSTLATFAIQSAPVAADTTVTISATANSVTRSAQMLVRAAHLAGLNVVPATIVGGDSATITATLDGAAATIGAVIALTSDRADVTVPSTLMIPAGATSSAVDVGSTPVNSATNVTITAAYAGVSKTATITVNPSSITLASLTLDPTSVIGGLTVTGTVALTRPAPPSGTVVTLASDDPSIASVPSSVGVPPGATTATFNVTTTTILTSAVVNISATYGGTTRSAPLTVQAPAGTVLYRLTIDPPNVTGGSSTTGTATLNAPAPNGGADVPLVSADPATVMVPNRFTVKRGETTATFSITTLVVTSPKTVDVSGSYGGLTQHAPLTVIPPSTIALVSLALNPATTSGGGTSTGTVTMSAPAPPGGVLITVAVKHRNVANAPPSIVIPGGATFASFVITAEGVHSTKTTDVTATYAGVSRSATLTVTPATAQILATEESIPVALSVAAQVATATPRRYSFYTPELNLLSETAQTSEPIPAIAYDYIWFGGQPLAQIENATGRVHYYFNDHLGTPVLTADASGVVDWRVEREPYGSRYAVRAGADRYQPLAFPGQEDDPNSDRSYNIFRWYRAGWGRYTEADPLGLGADINVYRYAASDPIKKDDVLGLDNAGCDGIAKYGVNETPCRLECCAQHDQCYDRNHCSAGSWNNKPKTPCDPGIGCQQCNQESRDCFRECLKKELFGTKDDPKKPNYYCGALHRFINIPGDFADITQAKAKCACDYSKACPYVTKPVLPTVPKRRP